MGPIRTAVAVVLPLLVALATATPALAGPSCAEGPQAVGETIVGTPCDDTIRAPRGIATVYGEGGNDTIYGQRGNDTLYGGEGADRLYGGVGDDHLRGGPGDDLLSGGFGADSLDGEEGSDYARGDATIDAIGDSGASGVDTLSFATGVTPGFPNPGNLGYNGFPEGADGRGVFVDLAQGFANDGLAPAGGGVDEPLGASDFESFERVIGTPFDDFIVGSSGDETIYGGGGGDVILGKGGDDHVFGGAGGDYCEGATETSCEFSGGDEEVSQRNPAAIAVGIMAPQEGGDADLYLAGSSGRDVVSAEYAGGAVTFALGAGSTGAFDAGEAAEGGCNPPSGGKVVCPIAAAPDSIVLAGLEGEDSLSTPGLPATTSPILLGGEGDDALTGGGTEDAIVDGPGNDSADAGGGDDAVPNNQGADHLAAGPGDDLFISNAVCEGDVLDGGEGVDNANWANFGSAVALDLGQGVAGLVGPGGQPQCESGTRTSLAGIEDLEGSNHDDTLIGDGGANQLLGRLGADSYFAAGGNDSILANSGDSDTTIDCGEGFDTAQIDIPTSEYADPAPIGCEAIHERPPNSFRPPDTPPAPATPAPAVTPPAPKAKPRAKDKTPPQTSILHRPRSTVFTAYRRRSVTVAFASSEPGSTFHCRLNRGPFRPCRSPQAYRLAVGPHTFRVYAIDRAGNRDRTPALARFRIRRR
jgi:Ca2+-binding RTX toxin-like protein